MKYTKGQLKVWEKDWRAHNKWLRQRHMPTVTLEQHIDTIHGKVAKVNREFKPYVPAETPPRRGTAHIPSASMKADGKGSTAKKEIPAYTGTYIIGVATMHKSNAVPVTNPKQAAEIAQMAK